MLIDESLRTDFASNGNSGPEVAESVAALIDTYLFDPRMSLAFIARLLGVGERKLQRDLERDGASFKEIYADRRIGSAKERLQASNETIFSISESLGYSNQAHFTRAFLRRTGVTPTAFRKGA